MNGRIVRIIPNEYGQEYGFIRTEGAGGDYYFDDRYILDGTMSDFYVDDSVSFEPAVNPSNSNYF